jgi:two-component system, chemotaxis family, CheB/CheR fusion protein
MPQKKKAHRKDEKEAPRKATVPAPVFLSGGSATDFPIVGIGASAGGLEAFKEMLQSLPSETGAAFVFVQHLDPTHESLATEILQHATRMPVREVTDGLRVEPNQVYVIPPNFDIALLHGNLNLLPLRSGARGQHLAIDSFFQTLALEKQEKAIGVILSGTASDGTQGLKAIKSRGGLSIVQDPKTAKYGGMPESAITSGFVDLVLSPKGIAKELSRIARHPYVIVAHPEAPEEESEEGAERVAPRDSKTLQKLFALLRSLTQIDFSHYKHSTIIRRIQRRMMVRKTSNLDAYFRYLQENPNEVQALYSDFLIHVTEFFRDPEAFQVLAEQVFPQIVKGRKPDHPIRVWVPGCSTGEEAYSLAIALLEFLQRNDAKFPIQIFATDISEQAVQKARSGIYPQEIENSVSKERLKAFFDKVDGGYKIHKTVRDLCLFSKHDVTSDPPFSKLDLVSCRNVLIYFSVVLQKRVLPIFHYSLNPGGFLFLGKSESIGELSRLFSVFDKVNKIFSKLNAPTPMILRPPVVYGPELPSRVSPRGGDAREPSAFQKEAEKIALARFAPPSVTVNADLEILQFQGRTAPCLEPGPGLPSNHLLKMARPELLHALRTSIQAAKTKNEPVKTEGPAFEVDNQRRQFNIEVVPANPLSAPRQRNYVVFFLEVPSPAPAKPPRGKEKSDKKNARDLNRQRILELEKELDASRQYQRELAEQYETSQEELTSANEELQSTNEELQSTNEELETSKEELQSSNEELTTVNDELQNRNADLVGVSSDLSNILSNVEFPIVIVGGDRRIRRFTPRAEELFNLIPGDIGRPLTDIKPNFESDLEGMVSRAISTLSPQESEILIDGSNWMRLQVRPYRTVDNRIDGAVITLVDISALKSKLSDVQAALKYSTAIAETLQLPLVVLNERLHLLSANRSFTGMFGIVPHKDIGSDLLSFLGGPGWNIPRLRQLLSAVALENQELKNFEVEYDFPDLGHRILLLNARQIHWQESMPKALLLSIDDVTDRRALERTLEDSEERFRRVVESAHDAIVIIDAKGNIEFANQRTSSFFGYQQGELAGKAFDTLIPDSLRGAHADHHLQFMADWRSGAMGAGRELFGKRKDGSTIPIDVSLSPIETVSGIKVSAIIRDISETKRLANERKMLLDQEKEARASADRAKVDAEVANATKDVFLATLSHELRTPVTSILSWAQLIRKNNYAPDKIAQGIQAIELSAKSQSQLIDDLLDVARIQSGKLSVNCQEIDPRVAVELAVDSIRFLGNRKKVTVEIEMNLRSETIWADPDRIQQIVWNLLTNAIKFSAVGGKVLVRVGPFASEGKKFVSIQVIDHGKGINPDFLPKLFHRFSQADSSSIRAHGGLGLGLALVRDLTQLHGGTAQAESEGLGKGATFTVLLPLKSESSGGPLKSSGEADAKGEMERPDLSGLKIMIVEDDPSTLEALAETIKSFGAETISFSTVASGLKAFGEVKPQLLVSDIAMPGDDGYSLIRQIRSLEAGQGGKVPALALTAYASDADVSKTLAAGFDSHMSKPFDTFRLGHALAKLAKRKK